MRRWVCVLTLVVVSVGTSTSVAVAARPTTTVDHFTVIECPVADGDLSGYVFALDSSASGTAFDVVVGDAFGFSGDPADVHFGAGTVTGTVHLLDTEEESLGDAVLAATFTPTGDVQRIAEHRRDGNVHIREVRLIQNLDVSGTLTALGTVFDLTDCFGLTGRVTTTTTSPGAFVSISRDFLSLTCSFETEDRFVFLAAFADDGFTDAFIDTSVGFGSGEDVVFTTTEFHASIDLLGFDTGDTATADASLTAASTPRIVKDGPVKRVSRTLQIEGTLSVPGLGEFDMSSCEAQHVLVEKIIRTTPGRSPALRA